MKTRMLDIDGPVHVADFGGSGSPIVLVHGLGGSYTNWMPVGEALAARGRVLAPDLIGFGRTPVGARAASIEANIALLARLIEKELGEPAVLVGNSMGGLLSVLLAAKRPDLVSRLVLVAPALPLAFGAILDPQVAGLFTLYMVPGMGELYLRRRMAQRGPEGMLRDMLRMCGVDPKRLAPATYEASVELARERAGYAWADQAFLASARSLVRTNMRRMRIYGAIRRIKAPGLIVQGTADRLVPTASSRAAARLRPDWRLELLPGVGHVPQIEVPDRWLNVVTSWLHA